MMRVLRKAWLPLIIIVVVVVAGFSVNRIRGYFGAHPNSQGSSSGLNDIEPFNPKVVKYEIWGEPGAYADINYLDLDAQPQRVDGASLPWSLTLTTTAPSRVPQHRGAGRR